MRRFVKLSSQTGMRDLRRNENPPLMNCMAFSMETFAAGVISRWMWSGMRTKACS